MFLEMLNFVIVEFQGNDIWSLLNIYLYRWIIFDKLYDLLSDKMNIIYVVNVLIMMYFFDLVKDILVFLCILILYYYYNQLMKFYGIENFFFFFSFIIDIFVSVRLFGIFNDILLQLWVMFGYFQVKIGVIKVRIQIILLIVLYECNNILVFFKS